jgi:hypothetical protein
MKNTIFEEIKMNVNYTYLIIAYHTHVLESNTIPH